jgi:hypothetical protein
MRVTQEEDHEVLEASSRPQTVQKWRVTSGWTHSLILQPGLRKCDQDPEEVTAGSDQENFPMAREGVCSSVGNEGSLKSRKGSLASGKMGLAHITGHLLYAKS